MNITARSGSPRGGSARPFPSGRPLSSPRGPSPAHLLGPPRELLDAELVVEVEADEQVVEAAAEPGDRTGDPHYHYTPLRALGPRPGAAGEPNAGLGRTGAGGARRARCGRGGRQEADGARQRPGQPADTARSRAAQRHDGPGPPCPPATPAPRKRGRGRRWFRRRLGARGAGAAGPGQLRRAAPVSPLPAPVRSALSGLPCPVCASPCKRHRELLERVQRRPQRWLRTWSISLHEELGLFSLEKIERGFYECK